MDEILDQLAKACGELKARINMIDKERFEIYGKSKTNWIKWGSEFRIGVTKVPTGVLVAIEDLAAIPSDRFIKNLYAAFSKRVPSAPLQAGVVDKTSVDGELDRRQDLVMPGGGSPDMAADIPDDNGREALPQATACKKCCASNPADNDYCSDCGHLLASCQNCGHVPEAGMSFCTKCGSLLN